MNAESISTSRYYQLCKFEFSNFDIMITNDECRKHFGKPILSALQIWIFKFWYHDNEQWMPKAFRQADIIGFAKFENSNFASYSLHWSSANFLKNLLSNLWFGDETVKHSLFHPRWPIYHDIKMVFLGFISPSCHLNCTFLFGTNGTTFSPLRPNTFAQNLTKTVPHTHPPFSLMWDTLPPQLILISW